MSTLKLYDSAYPGSMHQRDEGSYVERDDSASLAEALLQNLYAAQSQADDWKADAIRLEAELITANKRITEMQEIIDGEPHH